MNQRLICTLHLLKSQTDSLDTHAFHVVVYVNWTDNCYLKTSIYKRDLDYICLAASEMCFSFVFFSRQREGKKRVLSGEKLVHLDRPQAQVTAVCYFRTDNRLAFCAKQLTHDAHTESKTLLHFENG